MARLRVGLIGGGGPGSFFGGVHKRAISLDASRELVAGALRSNPRAAMQAARDYGIKGYPSYQALLEACLKGKEQLDYVTIVTPNHAHYGPARAFVEAGIPVLCEKPMTMTVAEAQDLARLVKRKRVPFVLAHTYTGHAMMMMARELVHQGEIGEVRKVEAWYNQGWLATALEKSGQQQASWRTDPKKTGLSNCGGDIGTHAFMAATWVSGLAVKRVSARLNTFVKGRVLDDDFNVVAELQNGATALITATQIAIGYKNDNGFRVFGTKGSLEWRQEQAESLLLRRGAHDEVYWQGANFGYIPDSVKPYLRMPAGHHEDFFEALANLHLSMEFMIRRRRKERVPAPFAHPGVDAGVAGMRFVAAAVASSKKKGAWTKV
ncbi:MAG: Gfo/Idh/MocA family oxidoreductase [Candidatus Handelsmanbacteria bacterium]|nr:Gfo/Idh/MocA family oxidoreductase [Candidatus Handelsmanbacteria bacterium]